MCPLDLETLERDARRSGSRGLDSTVDIRCVGSSIYWTYDNPTLVAVTLPRDTFLDYLRETEGRKLFEVKTRVRHETNRITRSGSRVWSPLISQTGKHMTLMSYSSNQLQQVQVA
jgi:hypothetical protein